MLERLQFIDQELFLFLNSLHSGYWDQFMWIFTAKLPWIPMYAAILYVICKNMRPSVSLLAVISIVLTIVYADQICATLIRPLVERMRPSNPNNPISEWVHIVNGTGRKIWLPLLPRRQFFWAGLLCHATVQKQAAYTLHSALGCTQLLFPHIHRGALSRRPHRRDAGGTKRSRAYV